MMIVNQHLHICRQNGRTFAYDTLTNELVGLTRTAVILLNCIRQAATPDAACKLFSEQFRSNDSARIARYWTESVAQLTKRGLIWQNDTWAKASDASYIDGNDPFMSEVLLAHTQPYRVMGHYGCVTSNSDTFIRSFYEEHKPYATVESERPFSFQITCRIQPSVEWHIPDEAQLVQKAGEYAHYRTRHYHYFQSSKRPFLWQVDDNGRHFHGSSINSHLLLEQARIFFEVAVTYGVNPTLLPFHGSVVRRDGITILLIGDSGQGKSTLAWALRKEHDFELLADDTFYVNTEHGGISGYLPHVALPTTGVHQFPEQLGTLYDYLCGVSRVLVPVSTPLDGSCQPDAFIILRRTNQAESACVAAQGDPAHMLIPRLMALPKAFWYDRSLAQTTADHRLNTLLALSQQAAGFGLYLGHQLPSACSCIVDIVDDLVTQRANEKCSAIL